MSIEHTYGYDLAMPFLGVEVPAHALFGLAAGRGSGGISGMGPLQKSSTQDLDWQAPCLLSCHRSRRPSCFRQRLLNLSPSPSRLSLPFSLRSSTWSVSSKLKPELLAHQFKNLLRPHRSQGSVTLLLWCPFSSLSQIRSQDGITGHTYRPFSVPDSQRGHGSRLSCSISIRPIKRTHTCYYKW